jgi:hypothetical protein
MARLEQRHEDFLVNVLDFIASNASAQEASHGGTDVVEQQPTGVGVTLLQTLHQVHADPAAFEALSVVGLFHSCGAAGNRARAFA